MRDHGDGGARDGIQADHPFVGPRRADFDMLRHRLAEVLIVEIDKRGFGYAEQQNRLGVLEHFHADEVPARIHADQRDHGLAGVGRRVGDVGGEHDVAEQLLACRVVVIGLDIGRLALAFREMRRAGKHVLAWQQGAHVPGGMHVGGEFGLIGRGCVREGRGECQKPQQEQQQGEPGCVRRSPRFSSDGPHGSIPESGHHRRKGRRHLLMTALPDHYASTIMRVRISRCSAWQKCVQ
ncbi:hypothetical protein SDC9_143391 [bioreactor metagenome]|uniref:Uncharacterized protein n=1 Tax=bioreactor metagenome TaxID=1076179 RepID=A0A645E601_9ZZZZ